MTAARVLVIVARRLFSLRVAQTLRPIVVSGPSGSGKTTLLKKAFAEHPKTFSYVVSHTTRAPREGERDGIDYYFVTRDEMRRMIDNGEFVEHALFSDNYYGTSKRAIEEVQKSRRLPVLDVDIQGVISIKRTPINARYVFIMAPSFAELERRLRLRGTDSEQNIVRRLERAKRDLEYVHQNSRLFDAAIINDVLDDAYEQFMQLVNDDIQASTNSNEAQGWNRT